MLLAIFALLGVASAAPPDSKPLTALLHTWVHDGVVDYAGLRAAGQPALRAYEADLKAHPPEPSWSELERMAYWINAYNVFTLQLILDNPGVDSIRDIGWPFSPWGRRFIDLHALGVDKLSLDDIEHKILRHDFHEPRVHFALVCASKSCPPLRSEAYTGAALDAQLDAQARRFLTDATKNRVAADGLHLSPIFKWYGEDFGDVRRFVAPYLSAPADASITWMAYDWSLNGG